MPWCCINQGYIQDSFGLNGHVLEMLCEGVITSCRCLARSHFDLSLPCYMLAVLPDHKCLSILTLNHYRRLNGLLQCTGWHVPTAGEKYVYCCIEKFVGFVCCLKQFLSWLNDCWLGKAFEIKRWKRCMRLQMLSRLYITQCYTLFSPSVCIERYLLIFFVYIWNAKPPQFNCHKLPSQFWFLISCCHLHVRNFSLDTQCYSGIAF